MINKIKGLIFEIKAILSVSTQLQKDNLALQFIKDFLPSSENYFPFTNSSINPHTLSRILNDIKINNRKNIIEFGGGLSTLAIAKFALLNKIDLEIITIENNEGYADLLKNILNNEGLSPFVKVIVAPLNESKLSLNNLTWYDESIVNESISNTQFDCIIVDGPEAWNSQNELSRHPAFPSLEGHIAPNFSLFVDDTFRNGEQLILSKWAATYNIVFRKINEVAHVSLNGDYSNPVL